MTIELPQELIEEILDHLDSDSLKHCSLVCWAWVFRARSLLFRKCNLNPKSVLAFRDLLRSPSCTFADHFRSIRATKRHGNRNDHVFDEIAADFVGIRELSLMLTCGVDEYAFYCTGFIAAFPHVTRLTLTFLNDCVEDFSVPLIDMICLFPALQALDIQYLFGKIADSPPTAVPPPGLHSVKLTTDSAGPILSWLNRSNHLPNVDSVSLQYLQNNDVSIVRSAMQRLGRSLRHLEIALIRTPPSPVDVSTVFDLTLHPNLQTLTIIDDPFQPVGPCQFFRLIGSLTAPKLERLSLCLDLLLYQKLPAWGPLDSLLASPRFPNLRSVAVGCTKHLISFNHDNHDNHDYLCTSLPLLVASKGLRMEW
ncbi:hypothetical protein K438DRAFT_1821383, partial [Mycena galopus ATCC 62051]